MLFKKHFPLLLMVDELEKGRERGVRHLQPLFFEKRMQLPFLHGAKRGQMEDFFGPSLFDTLAIGGAVGTEIGGELLEGLPRRLIGAAISFPKTAESSGMSTCRIRARRNRASRFVGSSIQWRCCFFSHATSCFFGVRRSGRHTCIPSKVVTALRPPSAFKPAPSKSRLRTVSAWSS